MIQLKVNGKLCELQQSTSVLEFLKIKNVNTKFIAIAHNGNILRKEEYVETEIQHGDVLEVVKPVGGG